MFILLLLIQMPKNLAFIARQSGRVLPDPWCYFGPPRISWSPIIQKSHSNRPIPDWKIPGLFSHYPPVRISEKIPCCLKLTCVNLRHVIPSTAWHSYPANNAILFSPTHNFYSFFSSSFPRKTICYCLCFHSNKS